jgi:hypothetical protein
MEDKAVAHFDGKEGREEGRKEGRKGQRIHLLARIRIHMDIYLLSIFYILYLYLYGKRQVCV